ncbi:alpha-galactosidase [Microbacterium sp. SORGH_AS_0888]|uniref:alpha-galactosidase n=1 Tax=Microbacterium sp. SORGH_AS_0888 TaxID=3041791 RepID=UPI0027827A04|nr:alpha-galactosidase [Microbacterium sp. SORGH_AS_0888]MDQ1130348.1 alpha-galactosidase [Microbacterium sp. SORGH_AS_0888]
MTLPAHAHLQGGGTSVVLDLRRADQPVIVHWGEDLGTPDAEELDAICRAAVPQRVSGGLDTTARLTVLPQLSAGWLTTPGLSGDRDGRDFSTRLLLTDARLDHGGATLTLRDDAAGLAVEVTLRVGPTGLLHQRMTLTNLGDTPYRLHELSLGFPVPPTATELLTTTGRHLRERSPERHAFTIGGHVRESRRGRPGADATLVVAAGTPGFGFERGRVHGVHLAWSGDHRILAERTPTGDAVLRAGELLAPGEIVLAPGGAYETPEAIGSWGDGLDAFAARFHEELRGRPQHPSRPRPVTLNTWEAVYFQQDLATLRTLADRAARVGAERFVLDDGWFHARRDDTAGLGDWWVDATVWPEGLGPLVEHVRGLGMEFGLWVEPEMVNLDSDLARAHPDWILRARDELPPPGRQQQVLDLAHPEAYAYIAGRLHALLDEYPIAYLKWDHNRDLAEAGAGAHGRPRGHENVQALYRLLDELVERHPGLEIESCASGGARVDLGILSRTHRIWTSDCLDPIERLDIQRYTGLVVPPELMGAHLTSPVVHSTGRTVSLDLSAITALFGHFGIEWDLTRVDDETLDRIAAWVALHRANRTLIATGRRVHADVADPSIDLRGIVASNGARALYALTQVTTSALHPAAPVTLPGLDPARRYRIALALPEGAGGFPGQSRLEWADEPVVMSGRAAGSVGLRPPVLLPQSAVLIEATAVS